jgi:hypothetical protein
MNIISSPVALLTSLKLKDLHICGFGGGAAKKKLPD